MTTETLGLKTTGTEEVLGLADALDRYAKSQAKAAAAPPIKSPVPSAPARDERGRFLPRGAAGVAPRSAAANDNAAMVRSEATAGATAIKWSERRKVSALDAIRAETEGLADIKAGFDSIYGAALKVGQVVWGAGKAVLQAQAFREDVTEALAIVAGGNRLAQQILDRAAKTADMIGRRRAEVSAQFLDLTTKGFGQAEAERVIKSIADISAIDPKASQEGLTKVIGKIKALGRINIDALGELNTFGLEPADVIRQIGQMMNKKEEEVIRLLSSSGGIRGLGVEPILRAINAQVGGGAEGAAAMAKARRNLSSLMDQVQAIPSELIFDISVGPGLEKTKGKLRDILEFFDANSKTGQEARAAIGDLVNAFAEGLFGIDTSKGTGVKDTLQAILDVVKNSKDDVRAFARGIAQIGSAIAWFSGLASSVANARAEFQKLSGVDLAGPLGIWKGLLLGLPAIVLQTLSGILQPILGFSLYDAGANLMSSFADGILSTAQAVIDAVTSTVGGAVSWAKKILGIASPSKVFASMGYNVSAGFAGGIASNDNAVTAAAAAMSRAATAGVSGTSPGQPGAPGVGLPSPMNIPSPVNQPAVTSGSPLIGSITIHVSGAKSEEEAESQGRAAFRGFAAELDKHLPGALRRLPVPAARAA